MNRPSPPSGDLNSLDPIEFYASNGIDLEASINEGETVEDGYEGEPDDDDQGNMDDEDKVIDPVVAKALSDDPPENASATAGAKVDTSITRIQLVRWAMLQDHWYQHNLEYLSGRIEMRGAPEIRVGYRLDLYDRNLSFYVESVNHQWRFPDKMVTVLQVTRGQPNNPFPMYVLPPLDAFDATDTQRSTGSGRLSKYFLSPDPLAVRRALVFRERGSRTVRSPGAEASLRNETDTVDRAVTYRERVVVPGSVSPEYENVETETIAVSGRLRWETEKTDLEQDTLDSWEFGGDSSSPEADAPVTGLTRDGSFENKVTPGG